MFSMKINRVINGILFCIILVLSLHFCIKCISVAFTHAFSFDGAIIAQVAKNMAEKFAFRTDYWNEQFYIPVIGAPVIFPIAVFFKIFGKSFETGLIINAIYMLLLFFSALYYLKYCLKLPDFFTLLFIIIFYLTNRIFEYGFGLYGEIPMIAYFILGLIFIHKYEENRKKILLFWAGVFLGLGVLTKFVFLLILPALLFVILLDFILRKKEKIKKFLLNYLLFFFGFILPNFLFEVYKLLNIGIKKFLFHWGWFMYGVGVQGGAMRPDTDRIKDTPNLFLKFNKHFDLLANYTNINKFILILLLVLGVVLFYMVLYQTLKYHNKTKKIKKEYKEILNMSNLFLISVMLTYFIWWIFIAPTDRAWHRRIIPGIVLYEICFVLLLFIVYQLAIKKWQRKKILKTGINVIGICLIFFAGFMLFNSENFRISFSDTKEKKEIMQAGRYMQTFSDDSEFFGFKWWQAPNISFASNKVFKDFFLSEDMKKTGEKQNKYLILDRPAMENQKLCIERILSDFEYELIYSYDEVRIYKLIKRVREREYVEECN